MIKLKLKDIKIESVGQDYIYPDIFDYRIGINQLQELFNVSSKIEYYELHKNNPNALKDKLVDLITYLNTKYSEDDISQFIDDLPDIVVDTHIEERRVPSGRKLSLIKGFVTRGGAIHNPTKANRAYNPNKTKMRLKSVRKSRPVGSIGMRLKQETTPTKSIEPAIESPKEIAPENPVDATIKNVISKNPIKGVDAEPRTEEISNRKVDSKLNFFVKQYGKSIPEAEIKQIYETLKTGADGKVASATNWVLRKYKDLQGEARDRFISEDLPSTVMDALVLHDKFNKRIKKAPLRKLEDVESFDHLYKITDGLKELKTNKEDISNIKENQTNVLHSDDSGEVLIPKTEEASKYYGSAAYKNVNTRWCTAADNDNMFNFYTKEQHPDSELFIMTYKGKNGELRKAQYHPESKQFKDEKDAELTRDEKQYIADNNPDAIKAIVEHRIKNGKSISDIASIDSHFFERPENAHYKDKAIKDIHKDSDINQFLETGKGEPFEDDLRKFTDEIVKVDKDYFKNNPREQKMLGDVAKKGIETGLGALGRYGEYSTLSNNLKTYKNLGLATPEVAGIVNDKVYKAADEALTGEDANIRVGSQILKVATALNPNHFKDNPDIQEKYLKMIEANITEGSYGFDYSSVVFDAANALDKNIEHPITKGMFQKQTNLVNSDFKKLNKMNKAFSREEMLRRVENGNIDDASMIGVTNIYDAFKNDTGSMDKSAQPVLDNLNKARKENEKDGNDKPNTYTLDGLKVHKTNVEHLLSTDEIANSTYKVIPDADESGDSDITPLLSDDNWGLLKQHVEDSGGGNIPLAKLKYTMALKGEIVDGQSQTLEASDINFSVRGGLLDRFDIIGDSIISDKNKSTSILSEVLGGTFDKKGYITVPYPKLESATDPNYEDFASGFEDSDLDSNVLPISKYNFGDKAAKAIGKQVNSEFKPDDEFNTIVKGHLTGYLTSKKNKAKRDNTTYDMIASGRF